MHAIDENILRMNVYRDINEISRDENTVLTIGTYDGVHLGHQKILSLLLKKASELSARNLVVTFEPHPQLVVGNKNGLKILTSIEEKENILREFGIENLLVLPFTKEFAATSSEEFVKSYLIEKIGMKSVIIGYDHRFGKGRDGNHETLELLSQSFGFDVHEVDAVSIDENIISSSKIRSSLLNGEVSEANTFLNRKYFFSGTVVEGKKIGRTLGFPTANLQLTNPNKLIPAIGIYAAEVVWKKQLLKGMLYIGTRPTLDDTHSIVPEVHIFDFDLDIYGEELEVHLVERVRDEMKFSSVENLIAQINTDKETCLEILQKNILIN